MKFQLHQPSQLLRVTAMSKAKEIASYASGWKATKGGLRELKEAAHVPAYFVGVTAKLVKDTLESAKEDRQASHLDAEGLWDLAVQQYNITTESVRSRFAIAYWMNIVLWLGFGLVVGNLLANLNAGAQFVWSNIFYLNIMLIVLFNSAYRMHCAITQSMPHPLKFMALLAKKPIFAVIRELPKGYQVGVRP
jgi:hypothetical protein